MQALVAGGAGFIGSHLCESLLNDGYFVICIDNLITGNKNNISHLLKNSKFKFIKEDITGKIPNEALDSEFIFHLASPASPNKNNPKSYINYPIETLLVNSLGTYNLLEIAKQTNAKFLYASSSEVYGDPQVSIQSENYFGNVNPNGVRSPYDEGKRFGEALTMAYFRKHKIDTKIIRIFNTYGPRMADDGRVVPSFIIAVINSKPITIYGKGNQTRSFCFVDDMVSGIKKAMFSKKTSGKVINLGNPDERNIVELANIIKTMTKSSSNVVFEGLPQDDPKIRRPDIKLAKKLINWSPSVSLEEGLKKTIEYFRSL